MNKKTLNSELENEDIDLVYAAPERSRNSLAYIVLTTMVRFWISLCCRASYLRTMRTFRAMRTDIYPWHKLNIHPGLVIEGLLSTQKVRTKKITVPYGEGVRGHSTYSIFRLAKMVALICATGILGRPLSAANNKEIVLERTTSHHPF